MALYRIGLIANSDQRRREHTRFTTKLRLITTLGSVSQEVP